MFPSRFELDSKPHPTRIFCFQEESRIRVAHLLPYVLVVLSFVLSGLLGHDPWKADEAYVFGVVQHMYETSDWVVPNLSGEPFMEKPPLFYWVATAFAHLLSAWLPLHDGARVACGFFMLITCWFLGSTARIWWGEGMGRYAVWALIASFGTLVQSHMMIPDISLLTGFAMSALGFATIITNSTQGGILLGLGAGIGFLSKGLIAPAVIGATTLVLPLCFTQWRTPEYWRGLRIAAMVTVPLFVVWPLLLYMRSPKLFMDWFWVNNIGRFLGFSVAQLGTEHLPWFWTQTIPWFTFPSLPIAIWMLWQKRLTALKEPAIQYAAVAFGTLMVVLAISSSGRAVYAWPLMVPIAIIAAPGATMLPSQAGRILVWISFALFGLLSFAIWAVWATMMLKGMPPNLPQLLRLLPIEFVPYFDGFRAVGAILITSVAFVAIRVLWNRPARGLSVWVVGMTLTWMLLTTLWMPWLDFAKSYRSVFESMPIPESTNCLASINLGEGERAMLRYVTGRNPVRVEVSPSAGCTTLLVQREVAFGEPEIDLTFWKELWRGSRPGVTNERFWLFQLETKARPQAANAGSVRNSAPRRIEGVPHL